MKWPWQKRLEALRAERDKARSELDAARLGRDVARAERDVAHTELARRNVLVAELASSVRADVEARNEMMRLHPSHRAELLAALVASIKARAGSK
jgi:uncharacterized protein (DUF3084 family)